MPLMVQGLGNSIMQQGVLSLLVHGLGSSIIPQGVLCPVFHGLGSSIMQQGFTDLASALCSRVFCPLWVTDWAVVLCSRVFCALWFKDWKARPMLSRNPRNSPFQSQLIMQFSTTTLLGIMTELCVCHSSSKNTLASKLRFPN